MKKLVFSLAFLLPITAFSRAASARDLPLHKAGEYVQDELLLMLAPGADIAEVEHTFANDGMNIVAVKCCARTMRVWDLKFADVNLESALELAQKMPGVEIAQYNHYVSHRSTVPNDPSFGSMWDMNNTGQTGGTPDADIDAPEAWDITTGGMTSTGDTIVVAVIDGGFDLAQQDLHFWRNYADIPGNSIDDDNNGYVDDTYGWDAYNSDGNITSDVHGTHVSGTIGAIGNNGVGVAGVNWGVQIMGVMGSDGTEAQIVEAYTYVLDARRLYNSTNGLKGAFVVATNSSFGVDQGQPSQYPLWCAMYDSLGAAGILSAGATANANWDIDAVSDIPTACSSPYMIAVTNTTNADVKFGAAGYGATTIDLGAPGTQILSTFPSNLYGNLSGTSMACPHVAGAVALMWAAACPQMVNDYKADPGTLALTMKNYMMQGVDVLPSMTGLCVSNGRLNLYNSLLQVQTYNCTSGISDPSDLSIVGVFPNPFDGATQVNFNSPANGEISLAIYDELGQLIKNYNVSVVKGLNSLQLDLSGYSSGTYFLKITNGSEVAVSKIVFSTTN